MRAVFLKSLFTFIFLCSADAWAYKCPTLTVAEKLQEADVVAIGSPLKLQAAHSMSFGAVQIHTVYKGDISPEDLFSQPFVIEYGHQIESVFISEWLNPYPHATRNTPGDEPISLREPLNRIVFVFPGTLDEVARHSDVQCAISLAGKDIDRRLLEHPQSLDSRFRGNDE